MRPHVLSFVALLGMGSIGYAQDQSGAWQGVFGPPGLTPPAASGASTPSAPDYGAVGTGPRVTIYGKPTRDTVLPSNITPAPILDRPGYGRAIVNGHRSIIDLNNNRIVRVID
jgi:hypothetical protein